MCGASLASQVLSKLILQLSKISHSPLYLGFGCEDPWADREGGAFELEPLWQTAVVQVACQEPRRMVPPTFKSCGEYSNPTASHLGFARFGWCWHESQMLTESKVCTFFFTFLCRGEFAGKFAGWTPNFEASAPGSLGAWWFKNFSLYFTPVPIWYVWAFQQLWLDLKGKKR